ncbi:MAG TPA: Rieske (2Fe-2S) protein [Chloroflexota bacterium]|nr:Rieske (2Fe-2S) protein [Chloroflexota bacterium]
MNEMVRNFVRQQSWLDTLGAPLQKALTDFYHGRENESGPQKELQNFLNGVWLGHPLHAILTDVPVGAWTATMVLDTIASLSGNDDLESAADLTLATGLAAAVPTIASGLTDWMDTYGEEMTTGLMHGLTMTTSTLLYVGSLFARLAGGRAVGVALSNLGYAAMAAGAYLGGNEVYLHGYPINHAAFQHPPSSFTPVMPESDLPERTLTKGQAGNLSVLLVREGDQVYALDDTCVHAGCSLSGGTLEDYVVRCPCHGSEYDIRTGSVVNGPATMPEPSYEARIENGMIEIKG